MPLDFSVREEMADQMERLRELVAGIPAAAQSALQDVAETLRRLALGRTPYATGELYRSWSSVTREEGGFSFSTDVPYAEVLERGLYPGVGPRTVEVEGGIFSRQAPGGILTPIVEDDEVIRKVVDLIVEVIEREVSSVTA